MSIEDQHLYYQHAKGFIESGDLFAPSADELHLLKEQEPGVHFKVVDDALITPGRQSRVSVLSYERLGAHHSVVWKRMAADKGLTEFEAHSMRDRLAPYRSSLEDAGWTIPKLFNATVVRVAGEYQIFSYEEYISGGDGEHMVASETEPNFRKWYLIEKILRLLLSYPNEVVRRAEIAEQELTLLPHGLDLKLANVVLEKETNQLYFVDLFGPKELDASGAWKLYSPKLDSLPPDNLRVVCATREGAILRFWRLARRSWESSRAVRPHLDVEFLQRLLALDPPAVEYHFIEQEIEQHFPWLNNLYAERSV